MKVFDQCVLVTGAGSGLGRATADLVAASGARVIAVDREFPDDTADNQLRITADILDEATFEQALDAADAVGPLRAVVHCAGRGGDRVRILDRDGQAGDVDSFRQVIEINLVGTYNVLRLSARRMQRVEPKEDERGVIVLTSSVAAFDGQIGQASYSASKAGVHGMTISAARDLAQYGIRVNTIAPGLFDTAMLARLRDDLREGLAATVPFPRRLGRPEEYASLALELIENPYLNGETIRLDGAIRMAPR
jgi:NAD(P)-dependent dehydrogenase (short-subunit alcohol dehydrogenase family)